jgi:photosystem II stability/assembly factor-like uncharacterized protein
MRRNLCDRWLFTRRDKRWKQNKLAILLLFCFCMSAIAACTGGANSASSTTQQQVRVNGFGTAANHVHSLLAFPDHVLLLATHYGLFRSTDDGDKWTLTAAGPNQIMDGMMTFSMVNSPINEQRLYVLTQPSVNNPKGIQGLYTSGDQGKTWSLAVKTATIGNMYFVVAGNASADDVFVYISTLGSQGLQVSHDDGKHFASAGTLPFGNLLGMLAVPGQPGHLLIYGDNGVASSSDNGAHWKMVKDLNSAIYNVTTPGAHDPIYAAGDDGVFVSKDGGKSFTLVYSQIGYGALVASPQTPTVLYGKTAQKIYESTDGGKVWNNLPTIKGNIQALTPDPDNAERVYLALSYPTAVYSYEQGSEAWASLTPRA